MNKILEAIREKNYDFFLKVYTEKGIIGLTDTFSEYINRRAYFTIDKEGKIKRKGLNLSLPLISTLKENPKNAEKIIKIIVERLCEPTERIKLKEITRLSNVSMDDLEKNYYKLLANSNDIFSVKYSKELLLRDKDKFIKLLFFFVLMEDISNRKQLMAYSLENFLGENFVKNDLDNIIQVAINYISMQKSNFSPYESSVKSNMSKMELTAKILENLDNLRNSTGLNLLTYIYILNKYDYNNEEKFISMAESYLNEILDNPGEMLLEEEEIILGALLKNIDNREK